MVNEWRVAPDVGTARWRPRRAARDRAGPAGAVRTRGPCCATAPRAGPTGAPREAGAARGWSCPFHLRRGDGRAPGGLGQHLLQLRERPRTAPVPDDVLAAATG